MWQHSSARLRPHVPEYIELLYGQTHVIAPLSHPILVQRTSTPSLRYVLAVTILTLSKQVKVKRFSVERAIKWSVYACPEVDGKFWMPWSYQLSGCIKEAHSLTTWFSHFYSHFTLVQYYPRQVTYKSDTSVASCTCYSHGEKRKGHANSVTFSIPHKGPQLIPFCIPAQGFELCGTIFFNK